MNALVTQGIPVYLLTGRSRENTLKLARAAGITNEVASCNGSVIFNPVTDENVRVRPMAAGKIAMLRELQQELGLELTWWTPSSIYVDRDGPCRQTLMELNETDVIVADPNTMGASQIVKIMMYADEKTLDAASARILQVDPGASRSMYCFYEFVDAEAHKWAALSHLLGKADIDPRSCLGLGDGGNDVGWLSRIGMPVAMGNARQEVTEVVRHRIGHHDDESAAALMEATLAALAAPWSAVDGPANFETEN